MYKIVCLIALVSLNRLAAALNGCPANEVSLPCGPRCPQECVVRPAQCKPVNDCVSGCFCKEGQVWFNGICRDEKTVCCPKNEVFTCGSACQKECATLGQVCPIQNLGCVENCFCIDGYARNALGVCILESRCPAKTLRCTKQNEHYEPCTARFEPSCTKLLPSGCGGSECIAKCVCNKDYVRDRNLNCVRLSTCRNPTIPTCGPNAAYQTCGNPCQGTCDKPDFPLVCKAPCRPGCFCRDGFLYNDASKMCVAPSSC